MSGLDHYFLLSLSFPNEEDTCVALFTDQEYAKLQPCKVKVLWAGYTESKYSAMESWVEQNMDWLKGFSKNEFLAEFLRNS